MNPYRLIAFTVLFVCHIAAQAAQATFMPIISYFSSFAYKSGMQNWACTQDSNGTMYFGNTNGLLTFDSYEWQSAVLPSHGIVRSLLADGRRIYAGSYTDFGFFERDSYGQLVYHSLWPKDIEPHNDEIWNIVKDGSGRIWFQSFSSLFCYDGRKVTTYYDKDKLPLWMFRAGNGIYVQLINGPLCRMTGGRYTTAVQRELCGGDNVVGLHTLPHGRLLLATATHGLYVKSKDGVKPLATGADAQIRHDIVNRTAMLSPDIVVVGTIKGGIYAIDLSTRRCLWHYDKHNALGNNTVLGLFRAKDGNLWATLDNGIALIHTAVPLSVARMDNIGMVYGMAAMGGKMYIATNQSAWQYDSATHALTQLAGCEGQNWYMENIYNKVIAGNNMMARTVSGNSLTVQLSHPDMGSTAMREYNLFGQRAAIEATYTKFRLYRPQGGSLSYEGEIDGFNAPVRDFEIDSRGTIWASHMSKGLYRLELSHDLRRFTAVKYYPSIGNTHGGMFHVMNINGRVVFATGDKLYTYDDIRKAIVPYGGCDGISHKGIVSAANVNKNLFWVLNADGYWLMQATGGRTLPRHFIANSIFGQECNVYGKSMFCDGAYTYFFLNDGIGRYDMRSKPSKAQPTPVSIASVKTRDAGNVMHMLPLLSDGGEPEVNGNITLRVACANYNRDKVLFHFTLKGGGTTIEEHTDEPEFSYSNLRYGSYTLDVAVTDINGKTVGTAAYAFTYPTPFYISWWAWLLYAATLFGAVYYYTRWRTARIVLHNKKIAERQLMQQKMMTLEKERIIAEQQKVILENELSIKGKDMASLAFGMATMKSSMEQARESLIEGMRNGSISSRNANKILQQMKDTDNDLFWATYRNNFDLIHKRFFRTLHERYPDLTSNDLRLCALLRLNLNTKEIASFTRLSIRGVEGARYRLRKKLGIPTDKSLTDFLIEVE